MNNHKIGIKIELLKDKNTGKLSIGVRFNSKASNILTEKDDFLWIPTGEEIDFLNEAFKMLSGGEKPKDKKTLTISSRDTKNVETKVEDKETIEKSKDDYKKFIEKDHEIIEEMIKKYIEKERNSEESDAHIIIDRVVNQKKRNKLRKL